MATIKNVFEGLNEIYEASVKECDESGYADTFKHSTELFFKQIKDNLAEYQKQSVTFEDIEYLDGYFIFGMGTNSVVHFHIKECPGWLFGIWWDVQKDKDRLEVIGQFFAQFEKNIDKFKPTHSEIKSTVYISKWDEEPWCQCYDAQDEINFIINEPYLAFCRDYYSWDYNYEYHTRAEAKKKYNKWVDMRENSEKYTKLCNEKILSFARAHILPLIKDGELKDRGEGWSPRYQFIAPLQNYTDSCDGVGDYNLFDIAVIDETSDDDELLRKANKLEKKYRAIEEKCHNIAERHKVYWHNPISNFIFLYSKKEDE